MNDSRQQKQGSSEEARSAPAWRRSAEWVSLILSSLLLLSIGGYLVYKLTNGGETPGRIDVTVLTDSAKHYDGQWIVPLVVENRGHDALQDLTIRVTRQKVGEQGPADSQDIVLDFLGEESRQEVSLYFDEDPRQFSVTGRPIYRVR